MTTLPTTIVVGSAGHVGHHNTLHGVYNLGTTKGDLIVLTGAQAYARLAVGADLTILEADSTQATGLKWGTAPIKATLFNAKGDLITATANDTPVILPVGANATILEADSTQADGIKWGSAPIKNTLVNAAGDIITASANDVPAILTLGSSGSMLIADTGITVGLRYALAQGATVATTESGTPATYFDLATVGPAITLTVGSSGLALIFIGATLTNNAVTSEEPHAAFAISGATTVAASDARCISLIGTPAGTFATKIGRAFLVTGLTPGSNVFTMKYRTNGIGTCVWANRHIAGIGL